MTARFSEMRRPPGISHLVLWLLCGLVLSMLAWSCIGELDVVTTARGRVITDGYIKSIQSSVNGSIKSIRVREGDFVKEGTILLELDPTFSQADVSAVQEKISQVQAELFRLEAEQKGTAPKYPTDKSESSEVLRRSSQVTLYESREAGLQQRIQEFKAAHDSRLAALSSAQSVLQGLESRLAIAHEKEMRARPYVDIAVPRFQYLQWKDDVLVLEKEISAQRQTNVRLARDIDEAQQRLLQVSSARQQDISLELSDKRTILKQLQAELVKANKRTDDVYIRAPQDGIVQKISPTTIGASVNTNDSLIQLVPANTPLVLEVQIPNEEKGYLQAGQLVDVKLDAFPFQKYGRLTGRLEWISPDAELSTTSNLSLLTESAKLRLLSNNVQQFVYRGKVRLQPESNDKLRLAPGLTAQVDIYTDKRRIIDFFLFPLQRSADEALRVR